MRTEANEPGTGGHEPAALNAGNITLPVAQLRLLAYKMRQMRQELDDTQALLLQVAAAAGEDLTLAVAERAANQIPTSTDPSHSTLDNPDQPDGSRAESEGSAGSRGSTASRFFGNQVASEPATDGSGSGRDTSHDALQNDDNTGREGAESTSGYGDGYGKQNSDGEHAEGPGHSGSETSQTESGQPETSQADTDQTKPNPGGPAQPGLNGAAGSPQAPTRDHGEPGSERGTAPGAGSGAISPKPSEPNTSEGNETSPGGPTNAGDRDKAAGGESQSGPGGRSAHESGGSSTGSSGGSGAGGSGAGEQSSRGVGQPPVQFTPPQESPATDAQAPGDSNGQTISSWHDVGQQERRRARRAKTSRQTPPSTPGAGGGKSLPRWGCGATGASRDERHDRPASERNFRPNPHGGASPDRIAGFFPGSDVRREIINTRKRSGAPVSPQAGPHTNLFQVPTADPSASPAGGQPTSQTGGQNGQHTNPNVPTVPIGEHVYHIPPENDLYAWQREAVEAWTGASHRGVVEAVTGAGKSRMAMAAIGRALQVERQTLVIVPTLQLVRQWVEGLRERFPGLPVGEVTGTAHGSFKNHVVLVTTMQSNYQRDLCRDLQGHGLLIGDEVHRLGADRFAEGLHQDMSWRLGLTATLERNDDGVQEFIKPYFGDVVYSLGYERALADDVIAPFRIALLRVPLNREESEQYDAASEKVAAARSRLQQFGLRARGAGEFQQRVAEIIRGSGSTMRDAAVQWQHAVNLRRGILADSRSKSGALDRLAPLVGQSKGCLIFTQKVDTANRAVNILADNGVQAAPVVSDQSPDERSIVMADFRSGHVEAVASPKVLDEGVDVPEADLGIVMAASRSRRQMVQRLGRVIRKKADGGFGKLVVMYAPGTSEDPACYDEDAGYLPLVTEHAQGVLDGNLDAVEDIERFLSLPTLPNVKPRFGRR